MHVPVTLRSHATALDREPWDGHATCPAHSQALSNLPAAHSAASLFSLLPSTKVRSRGFRKQASLLLGLDEISVTNDGDGGLSSQWTRTPNVSLSVAQSATSREYNDRNL